MFYRLVSEEIISNTFKEYKGIIQAVSTARSKEPELGQQGYVHPLPFADDSTRHIEDIVDRFVSYQDYVDCLVKELKSAGKVYLYRRRVYLPWWYRQPKYVEVMIEKDALRRAFKDILLPN
jgi:hypothetical protein